jgi:hypothetical protein
VEEHVIMRVAFCISGQLRTWQKSSDTWLKLATAIEKKLTAKVDFFSHTWDFNTLPNNVCHKVLHTDPIPETINTNEIQEYTKKINLVDFEVNDYAFYEKRAEHLMQISSASSHYGVQNKLIPLTWSAGQFYSLMRSAHLKKRYEMNNNFNYDIVFKIRNDLYFTDDMIDKFLNQNEYASWRTDLHMPKHNFMYSCHTSVSPDWPFTRVGDIFFYADSVTFDRVSNFYRWLPQITAFNNRPKGNVQPELVLFYYLKMMKINVHSISVDPKICRSETYSELLNNNSMPLGGFEIV